jgi:hypothetical protein
MSVTLLFFSKLPLTNTDLFSSQILSLTPSEAADTFNASYFDILPSGMPLWDVVTRVAKGEKCANGLDLSVPPELTNNTLVQILLCIPKHDVHALQAGVASASPNYLYYAYNTSISDIPTAQSRMPDGGAIEQLARHLSANKKKGTDVVYHQCLVSIHKALLQISLHGMIHGSCLFSWRRVRRATSTSISTPVHHQSPKAAPSAAYSSHAMPPE